MILFSFIIPVYNVEKYLSACLDSVINQTYTNWEAILIDDGSNDNSATICDKYSAIEERIKVFHRKNVGSLMARRFGISQAQGQYFLFIDSDDMLNSKLLEKVNKIIKCSNSDMIIYQFQHFGKYVNKNSPIVFKNGTIIEESSSNKEQLWRKIISGNKLNYLWLKAVNRSIVDFDTDYQQYAFMKSGTDLMQSMALLDNATKIYFSDEILYYYRYNDSGISSMKTKVTNFKSLKEHMKTRKLILEQKLYYLTKNNFDTIENLQLFYKFNFMTKMQQVAEWIASVKNRRKRIDIIKFALNEQILDDGKKYLKPEMFKGIYRQMYKQYISNSRRIYKTLIIYSYYLKIISGISLLYGKLGISLQIWLRKYRLHRCWFTMRR